MWQHGCCTCFASKLNTWRSTRPCSTNLICGLPIGVSLRDWAHVPHLTTSKIAQTTLIADSNSGSSWVSETCGDGSIPSSAAKLMEE